MGLSNLADRLFGRVTRHERKGMEAFEQKDYGRAIPRLVRAARLGSVIAQRTLGAAYLTGQGVVRDPAEAAHWLRAASQQDDFESQYQLAVLLYNGADRTAAGDIMGRWFATLLEKPTPTANANLELLFPRGVQLAPDHQEALHWCRKSAEAEFRAAQSMLGQMLYKGKDVPQDIDGAVYWLTKASEAGCAVAALNLANLYMRTDLERPADLQKAAYHCRQSARLGNSEAQFNLALMLDTGRGVPQNRELAMAWYRRAARQGVIAAQINLSAHLRQSREERDQVEAVRWYRAAAMKGNPLAEYNLGRLYDAGRGVRQDPDQAAESYRKAAEKGFAPAQLEYAFCCIRGKGVPTSPTEAAHWFRKAAEQGNGLGQANLGMFYLQGRGVPRDLDLAREWLGKALNSLPDGPERARVAEHLAAIDQQQAQPVVAPPPQPAIAAPEEKAALPPAAPAAAPAANADQAVPAAV